jgi:hypothetical protein
LQGEGLCRACSVGRFARGPGSEACEACPLITTTAGEGATGSSSCFGAWTSLRLEESSLVQGAPNALTLTFAPSTALGSGSVVTATGLTGSSTPDDAGLALGGGCAPTFASRAGWSRAEGVLRLVVAPGRRVDRGETCSLTVSLLNPRAAQTARRPIVAAARATASDSTASDSTAADPSTASLAALIPGRTSDDGPGCCLGASVAASWAVKTLRFGSSLQGADNAATLSFETDAQLSAGHQIRVTGLVGTQTPDDPAMPLTSVASGSDGCAARFGSRGAWTQQTGTLTLTLALALGAGQLCELRFTVRNSATSLAAARPTLSTSPALVPEAALAPPDGAAAGFAIGWQTRRVSETPSAGGAPPAGAGAPTTRTLTATLQPSVDLGPGSVVRVGGLAGVALPDDGALSVRTTSARCAAVLGSTAAWAQSTGTVTLTVRDELWGRSLACAVAFDLPARATGAPPLLATASARSAAAPSGAVVIDDEALDLSAGGVALSVRRASESPSPRGAGGPPPPAAGAWRTVSLVVRPSAAVPSGRTVRFGRLGGAAAPAGVVPIPLAGGCAHRFSVCVGWASSAAARCKTRTPDGSPVVLRAFTVGARVIRLVFDEAMPSGTVDATDFAARVADMDATVVAAVRAAQHGGRTIDVRLGADMLPTQSVVVSFTRRSDASQRLSGPGGAVASFAARVANNVGRAVDERSEEGACSLESAETCEATPGCERTGCSALKDPAGSPAVVSATVNAFNEQLTLVFDEAIVMPAPEAADWTATVGGQAAEVDFIVHDDANEPRKVTVFLKQPTPVRKNLAVTTTYTRHGDGIVGRTMRDAEGNAVPTTTFDVANNYFQPASNWGLGGCDVHQSLAACNANPSCAWRGARVLTQVAENDCTADIGEWRPHGRWDQSAGTLEATASEPLPEGQDCELTLELRGGAAPRAAEAPTVRIESRPDEVCLCLAAEMEGAVLGAA